MKRDGRSFDHRTLEVIRLMAVERVRAGERPTTVIASYGFSRTDDLHLWTALPLQADFELNCLASCKHLSGVAR